MAPDSASSVISLDDVTVVYGKSDALSGVSVQFPPGAVGLLGPNGAGKSTFLKLLTGEVRPEAKPGTECRLFGEPLWSLEEIRHRIGIVMPEEVARFHPLETARDVVLSSLRGAYGRTRDMRFSPADKKKAEEVMERMGVAPLAERDFGTLSSGEKRRFLIGRSLVHDPEILVLDEPSTALDFAASIELTSLLRTLPEEGRTLVLVTHHPGEIPPEITRVVLLREGRVIADGPSRRVITSSRLTDLYRVPLSVSWSRGWCGVGPG